MRVGLASYDEHLESLSHVRQTTLRVLARQHELRPLPHEYSLASRQRRCALLKEWLGGLDAIVGPLDHEIMHARREMANPVPWAAFVLGTMPRGAFGLSTSHRYLHTTDLLICNCSADVTLTRMLFPNASTRLVPFAYDDTIFYPADETRRLAAREELGIAPDTPLVVYAGRLTIEKNVHTVLKTFSVVLEAVPGARLLIAGGETYAPFQEFGTLPLSTKRLLRRFRRLLGLDASHVMLIGQRSPVQLRELYSTADVLLNLTLHHDENFGLAQVEAMACGLPVVGSSWGGLKDTIIDGVTGVQVPVAVTNAGVKVDWWAATNSVVDVLSGRRTPLEARGQCAAHTRAHYSPQAYGDHLERALRDCLAASERRREPLRPSPFATEFWSACAKNPDEPPPYRRGKKGLSLYQELIMPYAGSPAQGVVDLASTTWYLPAPLVFEPSGTITVNDPIFPLEVIPPTNLSDAVRALGAAFAEQPVRSGVSCIGTDASFYQALSWLYGAGLILPSVEGHFEPDWTRLTTGQATCRMQRVDHDMDLVWFC